MPSIDDGMAFFMAIGSVRSVLSIVYADIRERMEGIYYLWPENGKNS